MDLNLKGKTALVMGASRGLGRGIAASLAKEGCNLVLAARNLERIENDAQALAKSASIETKAVGLDLCDPASVQALLDEIKSRGGIDILIGNVGGPPPTSALGNTADLWTNHFHSMVLSLIQIMDTAVPFMRAQKWGRVLTITSSGVVQPIPTLGISNTLRASIVAFSKTLANEVAADGVTVNVVMPGRIDTERVAELDAAAAKRQNITVEEARSRSAANIPTKRYGKVEEFAQTCTFLVSEPAGYITGSNIRIDGGLIQSVQG